MIDQINNKKIDLNSNQENSIKLLYQLKLLETSTSISQKITKEDISLYYKDVDY